MPATEKIRKEIEHLRETLRHHEHLYYVLDQPSVTDAEYDELMRKLSALEKTHPELIAPDSPTQRVGGKPREGFVKVPHSTQMLGLDNALDEGELRDFLNRIGTVDYVTELKLDVLSMAAHYRDGKFFRRYAHRPRDCPAIRIRQSAPVQEPDRSGLISASSAPINWNISASTASLVIFGRHQFQIEKS